MQILGPNYSTAKNHIKMLIIMGLEDAPVLLHFTRVVYGDEVEHVKIVNLNKLALKIMDNNSFDIIDWKCQLSLLYDSMPCKQELFEETDDAITTSQDYHIHEGLEPKQKVRVVEHEGIIGTCWKCKSTLVRLQICDNVLKLAERFINENHDLFISEAPATWIDDWDGLYNEHLRDFALLCQNCHTPKIMVRV